MRFRLSFASISSLLAVSACDNPFSARFEEEMVVLGVSSFCYGFAEEPEPCFRAVRVPSNDTIGFYDGEIRGFTFEYGLRQHLLVERLILKNPPADGSSWEFRLIRVISRKRVSEEYPMDVANAQTSR